MRISRLAVAAVALALCGSAHATEFIKNGDFAANGGTGQLGVNTFAMYWNVTTPNYAFLFHNGTDSGISLDSRKWRKQRLEWDRSFHVLCGHGRRLSHNPAHAADQQFGAGADLYADLRLRLWPATI